MNPTCPWTTCPPPGAAGAGRTVCLVALAATASLAAVGCKSNIDQQLLERELRLQEDQIYQLQDELVSRQSQLERREVENASLRKQLGIADGAGPGAGRLELPSGVAAPARAPVLSTVEPDRPVLVPPVVIPPASATPGAAPSPPAGGGLRFGPPSSPPGTAPPGLGPGTIAPPVLDGVPPLPVFPAPPGSPAAGPRAGLPPVRRLSHEETVAAQPAIAGLVVNATHTACIDADGDGTSDALALVVEPRDASGRLVAAGGDVTIAVFDESVAPPVLPVTPGGGDASPPPPAEACLVQVTIPEAEVNGHFRATSRARGLHFSLPWRSRAPVADHVRVIVSLVTLDGRAFTADALVATRR